MEHVAAGRGVEVVPPARSLARALAGPRPDRRLAARRDHPPRQAGRDPHPHRQGRCRRARRRPRRRAGDAPSSCTRSTATSCAATSARSARSSSAPSRRSSRARTDRLIAVSPEVRDELVGLRVAPGREVRRHPARDRARAPGPLRRRPHGGAPPRRHPSRQVRRRLVRADDGGEAHRGPPDDAHRPARARHRRPAPARRRRHRPRRHSSSARTISGIARSCLFLGYQEDVAPWYAICDAVVLTSASEGTPVTIIEALAAGRPVVSTRVGGVPDVVDEGETGFLVRRGDTHAMAERLELLAREPRAGAEMGETGRARVLERYAVARLVDDVDGLYRELLDDDARRRPAGSASNATSRSASRSTHARRARPGPRASFGASTASRITPATSSGPPGSNDDSAPDLLDEPDGLAVRVGGDEHRPAGREDPVEPARDDEPGEPAREARRSGGRRRRATAAAPRAAGSRGSAPSWSPRAAARAASARRAARRTRSPGSGGCSRSRRNVAARTSVSRSWACPTLPECITTNASSSAVLLRPGVVARLRRERRRVDPVRDHLDAAARPFASRRSFIVSPIATTRSARAGTARRAAGARRRPSGFSSRLTRCAISGNTSWLMTRSGDAEPPRDEQPDVADDRRVGHAEHEVGPLAAKRGERGVAEVARVVRGAEVELRALVRGRADAQDPHAVAHLLRRAGRRARGGAR